MENDNQGQAPETPVSIDIFKPLSEQPAVEAQGEKETKVEAPAPEVKKDPFSKNWGALHRQEKELRQREQAIKTQAAEVAEYKTMQDLKKRDPKAWLAKQGLTFEELTQSFLKDEDPVEAAKKYVEEKLGDFETKQLEAQKDLQAKVDAQRLEDYKHQVKSQILTAGDTYELVNSLDEYELVYNVIEEYWNLNQKVLDNDTAAATVESYLAEREAARLNKLQSIKKFKKQDVSTETQKATTVEKSTNPTQKQKESKTLTGQHAATPTAVGNSKKLSNEESVSQAASLLKWE